MDQARARDRLEVGLHRIEQKRKNWTWRQRYYDGDHDLPYAPEGVSVEYLELRKQAIANWLALAMDTPLQRLRIDGFRTGRRGDADESAWNDIWQPNRLDSRLRIVLTQRVVHGRGLLAVWPNLKNRARPLVRVENDKRVHLEPDPDDPWTFAWAVKTYTIDGDRLASGLVLPDGSPASGARQVGLVYDDTTWHRFERAGAATPSVSARTWRYVQGGNHPMGELPMVPFDNRQDADAEPHSAIEKLIPAQNAINTVRFQTLLAMQFSAYRQRVFTGYDPVVRDDEGNVVYRTDDAGNTLLDHRGEPIPLISSPGRVGVDRALVFPGADTKVFDMQESNLDNYVKVLGELVADLAAIGQVPPQYLLNRMANLSGDAMNGAESTLKSLISDMQRECDEPLEQVMRMGNRARGEDHDDVASEAIWGDGETRSFAQLVDAIVKLIGQGFPQQAAWEMLPGATPQTVKRWMQLKADERQAVAQADPIGRAAEALRSGFPAPDSDTTVALPPPDADPAPASRPPSTTRRRRTRSDAAPLDATPAPVL